MKKKYLLFIPSVLFIMTLFIHFNASKIKAEDVAVDLSYNTEGVITILENHSDENSREIMVNVLETPAGRRLTDFVYCDKDDNCDDDANWHSVSEIPGSREVTAFENSVGTSKMTFWFNLPSYNLYFKAVYTDYEPMDIYYANYLGNEYYDNDMSDLSKYDTLNELVIGYKGGDIILPEDCLENGCLLKVTLTKENYQAYKNRVDYYNQYLSPNRNENIPFVDLSSMFNHLETVASDSVIPLYENYNVEMGQEVLVLDKTDTTVSFYLLVNKFFSERDRSNFTVGDNQNRILSPDYIGLNYKVDRKYYDEGSNYGFLSFNEYNNYYQDATIFYGTPKITLGVDDAIPVALTNDNNTNHMGVLKNQYNKIVSNNNEDFPIDDNFELTIKSFYNPDYEVSIALMKDDKLVKNVTLNLSRFAFGEIDIVDENGTNCRRLELNPDCSENAYVAVEYRGLYDTFYSNGEPATIDAAFISEQRDGLEFREEKDMVVIKRNLDFNPWAVAIYYHNDEVVGTRSFNLGELTKIEGYSEDPIANDKINGKAKVKGFYNNVEYGDQGGIVTNYDSSKYSVFGYGLGHEISVDRVKYFAYGSYMSGNLNYQLKLVSKQEVEDNKITRIALFLTNGELKDDEANFPELKYGVGEGKIYYLDNRTFDRMGDDNE